MSQHIVKKVLDGNTFEVAPIWLYNGRKGTVVRLDGLISAESGTTGGDLAKERLASLILNQKVELGGSFAFDRGRLVCDVYLKDRSLLDQLA